jgi:hypothetical protein
MTESLLGEQKNIVGDDFNCSETRSTFDRLLRDYFEPQAECAVGSISDSPKGQQCTGTSAELARAKLLRKFDVA